MCDTPVTHGRHADHHHPAYLGAKRRITAAARRAGLSPAKFISTAALDRADATPDDAKLARLERVAAAPMQQ